MGTTSNTKIQVSFLTSPKLYHFQVSDFTVNLCFRDAPPSTTFLRAITELLEKSQTLNSAKDINSHFIRIGEIKIADLDFRELIYSLESKRLQLDSYVMKEEISDFETIVSYLKYNLACIIFCIHLKIFFNSSRKYSTLNKRKLKKKN